jgi:MHS family proline/betaine transporter-like MFS transporter
MAGTETSAPAAPSGADASAPTPGQLRKTVLGSIVGTFVEYYDFGLYGFMATILAAHFFSSEDPTAALLGTLAAFAVAFVMRLPGGILFGHIGDKYGRKQALSLTIVLMCLSTVGVGLLPTYATLGIWATSLLVLMRCLQGIAAGGEITGASAFVAETAPANRRAAYTASLNSGSSLAMLFASLVAFALTSLLSKEQLMDWAWRLPFILSLPLALVGIWIRSQLQDSPEFRRIAATGQTKKVPLFDVLRSHKANILQILCLSATLSGGSYLVFVYGNIYLQTVGGFPLSTAFLSTCICLAVSTVVFILGGFLSDLFGRRTAFLASATLGLIVSGPCFAAMSSGSAGYAIVGHSTLGVFMALSVGPTFASFVELLPASVRYSGIALGNNLAHTLLGGTSPLVCAWLVSATGYSLAPAAVLGTCFLLVIVGAIRMKETSGIDLSGERTNADSLSPAQ